ncbi:hypothetical protein G7Y89_g10814 [Cudoniella acicularis]|uniref:Major facilitator superfamily (MFS) profile domain-containing protein n=1 Tax=Cudoniella acicularis TaxID=354080 RepID=A0A8H4W184_9HELO|nr:hypothetical protein G7Y89_g10814 [Cudoniella acicularis]
MVLWFLTFIGRVNIANAKVQALELGQGLINNYGGIITMRLFVGQSEAGLVPGTVTLLSNYYLRYYLQWQMSLLVVTNALASSFGGLLAYAIIGMDGDLGRKSWRWVFIIEGAVTGVAVLLGMLLIVDWPEKKKFLNDLELKLIRHLISIIGLGVLLTPQDWTVTPSIRYTAIYFVSIGSYISLPILWVLLANNVSGVYKTTFASSVQIGLGSVDNLGDNHPLFLLTY